MLPAELYNIGCMFVIKRWENEKKAFINQSIFVYWTNDKMHWHIHNKKRIWDTHRR